MRWRLNAVFGHATKSSSIITISNICRREPGPGVGFLPNLDSFTKGKWIICRCNITPVLASTSNRNPE